MNPKIIETTHPSVLEWCIQIINILIVIGIIVASIYLCILVIKLGKKSLIALDLWIKKNS